MLKLVHIVCTRGVWIHYRLDIIRLYINHNILPLWYQISNDLKLSFLTANSQNHKVPKCLRLEGTFGGH